MKFDNLLEDPVVSLSDRKNYKILKLQNGLKVLLIKQHSDNDDELCRFKKYKSNVAAVALCVYVGSFQDPREIQGMSHLLEHVVSKLFNSFMFFFRDDIKILGFFSCFLGIYLE